MATYNVMAEEIVNHSRRGKDGRLVKDPRPPAQRFWSKVRITEGCWYWTAGRSGGYGMFSIEGHGCGAMSAHQFSYLTFFGFNSIPEGMVLDHLCRVRHCVNPYHLEPVTRGVNTLRGETLPAVNLLKTHCPKGHPYSGRDKYQRNCRPCKNETERHRRERLKANV
jgi:hypothetical protein